MLDTNIPQSMIINPSAARLIAQVKENPSSLDDMSSSDIVRALFGIGASNLTTITITMALEESIETKDRERIRSAMADRGVSGVIWRFITDAKFCIEFGKGWSNGSSYRYFNLIRLNDETPNEPASTIVRDLVKFNHDGCFFYDKSSRTIKYDFNMVDAMKKAYEESKTRPSSSEVDDEVDKMKDKYVFVGNSILINRHKDEVIRFVIAHHGVLSPEDIATLCAQLKCDVKVDINEENRLMFTFATSAEMKISFESAVIGCTCEDVILQNVQNHLSRFAKTVRQNEDPKNEGLNAFSKEFEIYLKGHQFSTIECSGKKYKIDNISTQREVDSIAGIIHIKSTIQVKEEIDEPIKLEFKISLSGDETIRNDRLLPLEQYLNEVIDTLRVNEDLNHDAVLTEIHKTFSKDHFDVNCRTEKIENECVFKIELNRKDVPSANKFEFVSNTAGYGAGIIANLSDLECNLPINMPVDYIVMMTNGIFHSKSITDYRACGAELIGSTDLDDYTSERTWKIFFEMTPEALETENLHREKYNNLVESLKVQHPLSDLNAEFHSNFSCTVNALDEIECVEENMRAGDIVRVADTKMFCGWDGSRWLNVTDAVTDAMRKLEEEEESKRKEEAYLNSTVIHKGDSYYLKPVGNEECEVKIIRYDTNEKVFTFCDPNTEGYAFGTDPYIAKEDLTPKMFKENQFSTIMEWFYQEVKTKEDQIGPEKKEETQMEKLKIDVADTLTDCKESLVAMLTSIISEFKDPENNIESIERKLINASELDTIRVHYNGNSTWFIDQPIPETEETQEEESPSADIHDQDVQMNLLRGLFGVADPAITHVQRFLRNHLTEIGHDGYALTETFPTETFIAWDTKPYNFAVSIVKFKDGRFYRMFLAYNNSGLEDQTWMATKNIPGRWIRLGRDIQNIVDYKPNFNNRRR